MARLIDADELIAECKRMIQDSWNNSTAPVSWAEAYATFIDDIETCETVPAYGQWVSMEDKWPQNGEWILAYLSDGNMISGGYYGAMGFALDYHYEDMGQITHWMPLPEPPEERYKCRYADANGVCSKCSGNEEIIYCVEGPCPYMFEEASDDGAHIEP